ncbi:flagellar hook-length control protein FliK [Dechloromonas sp. TW-R-39-2]|nr:flagellar hook-length control protein FliK [Dechloromonas sp. TW-R-39-2]
MIPADLASRLRQVTQDLPAPVQPAPAAQKVADVLSEFSVGQRIMAEIQSLLPNGTYRAVIAQRDLTLALPFSAKAGDTIELEVVENDGKLTLAVVGNKTASEAGGKGNDSVSTSLSKTGNLIGELLGKVEQQGGQAKPAALNANQPLVTHFSGQASELLPALKESLSKSGMFYEAHQAQWLEGKLSTANLLQEPQGKLSTLIPAPTNAAPSSVHADSADIAAHVHLSEGALQKTQAESPPANPSQAEVAAKTAVTSNTEPKTTSTVQPTEQPINQRTTAIHPELTPIVQQQLNALATQTYVWQGQVWPGQPMHWEITEDDGRPRSEIDETPARWQTRLKLDLPNLGGIEARLRLGNTGSLELTLTTDNDSSEATLRAAAKQLGNALEASGLQLNKFAVTHGEITP